MRLVRSLLFWALALAPGLAFFANSAIAAPRVLNILAWADYFDPKILNQFNDETGIRIVYDSYSTLAQMEARLKAPGDYDVVVVPGAELRSLIGAGALRPLDQLKDK